MSKLTFQQLRDANVERLSSSKYKLCEQNWQPAHWVQALVGEVGEAANILKKVDRGDFELKSVLPEIAKELADIQCYLDILAHKLGVDLGDATVGKFNEVSKRIGSDVRLPTGRPVGSVLFCHGLEDGWYAIETVIDDKKIVYSGDWDTVKSRAIADQLSIELLWSKENPASFRHYCPSELNA